MGACREAPRAGGDGTRWGCATRAGPAHSLSDPDPDSPDPLVPEAPPPPSCVGGPANDRRPGGPRVAPETQTAPPGSEPGSSPRPYPSPQGGSDLTPSKGQTLWSTRSPNPAHVNPAPRLGLRHPLQTRMAAGPASGSAPPASTATAGASARGRASRARRASPTPRPGRAMAPRRRISSPTALLVKGPLGGGWGVVPVSPAGRGGSGRPLGQLGARL